MGRLIVLLLALHAPFSAGSGLSEAPPSIRVSVSPRVALTMATLKVTTRITPHFDNRAFCVALVLDGDAVRRVCFQLEGDGAAITYVTEWREVMEPGDYMVVADLYRGTERVKPFSTDVTDFTLR